MANIYWLSHNGNWKKKKRNGLEYWELLRPEISKFKTAWKDTHALLSLPQNSCESMRTHKHTQTRPPTHTWHAKSLTLSHTHTHTHTHTHIYIWQWLAEFSWHIFWWNEVVSMKARGADRETITVCLCLLCCVHSVCGTHCLHSDTAGTSRPACEKSKVPIS